MRNGIFVSYKVVQKLFKVVNEPWKPSEMINKVFGELTKSSHFTQVIEENGKSLEILILDSAVSDGQLGTSIYNYLSCHFFIRRQGRHYSREI